MSDSWSNKAKIGCAIWGLYNEQEFNYYLNNYSIEFLVKHFNLDPDKLSLD